MTSRIERRLLKKHAPKVSEIRYQRLVERVINWRGKLDGVPIDTPAFEAAQEIDQFLREHRDSLRFTGGKV